MWGFEVKCKFLKQLLCSLSEGLLYPIAWVILVSASLHGQEKSRTQQTWNSLIVPLLMSKLQLLSIVYFISLPWAILQLLYITTGIFHFSSWIIGLINPLWLFSALKEIKEGCIAKKGGVWCWNKETKYWGFLFVQAK